MSPYDITRPAGIESTTSSTWLAKSSTGGASRSCAGSEAIGGPWGAVGPPEQGQAGPGRADQDQRGQREQQEQDQLGSPPGPDRLGRRGAVKPRRGRQAGLAEVGA